MNSDEFLRTLQNEGYLIDAINPNGKIQRMGTKDKPTSKSGWYAYHKGRYPFAVYGDWRTGEKKLLKGYDNSNLSIEARREIQANLRKIAKQKYKEQEKTYTEAAQKAKTVWDKSNPLFDSFNYLHNKKVKNYGLRSYKGQAIIPILDVKTEELISLQFIGKEGVKRFLSGGRTRGGYHQIGKPKDNRIYICEGYATGAAIHEVTGDCVAVAFNSGNLQKVSRGLSERYPEHELIIAADNDRFNEINVGVNKAKAAADSCNCAYVVPSFPEGSDGTDFNDLFINAGKDEVLSQLNNTVRANSPKSNNDDISNIKNWLSGKLDLTGNQVLNKLADMSPIDTDPFRKEVSQKLNIRITTLDVELRSRRKVEEKSSTKVVGYDEIEPWPEPVDGKSLITALTQTIDDIVILDKGYSTIIAL